MTLMIVFYVAINFLMRCQMRDVGIDTLQKLTVYVRYLPKTLILHLTVKKHKI